MKSIRSQTEAIRSFVLNNVNYHGSDIATLVAANFGISRQATHRHLKQIISHGLIESEGKTRNLVYRLSTVAGGVWEYQIANSPEEHGVWEADVAPLLKSLPKNVFQILQYGFAEMFNNAIDHASGKTILVSLKRTAMATEITIHDDGMGIFKKIKEALGLQDERHAVLELAKGKLTTDPSRHSGEGIFLPRGCFDHFLLCPMTFSFLIKSIPTKNELGVMAKFMPEPRFLW